MRVICSVLKEPCLIVCVQGRSPAVLEREKEYRKLFELPDTDLLVGDWTATFIKGVARHGRLFVFSDHLCFYSNLFGTKTSLAIPFVDVIGIDKTVENLTPGIKVRTNAKSYNFGSLYTRVRVFETISNVWKGSYVLVEETLDASDSEATTITADDETKLLEVCFVVCLLLFPSLFSYREENRNLRILLRKRSMRRTGFWAEWTSCRSCCRKSCL